MGSKAFHSKTRNGCVRCKQRRVKCSGNAPVCLNCHRRNETCTYPSWNLLCPAPSLPTRLKEIDRSEGEKPAKPTAKTCFWSGPLTSPLNDFPYKNTIYITRLQQIFWPETPSMEKLPLWTSMIDRAMDGYSYIRHSIVSVLCLHSQVDNPSCSRKDFVFASRHHLAASTLFRKFTKNVGDQNWSAVLFFSVSMIVFELGAQSMYPDGAFDYMEAFQVLRFARSASFLVREFLQHSDAWTHIQRGNILARKAIEAGVISALQETGQALLEMTQNDEHRRRVYSTTFHLLQGWVYCCNASPRTWRELIAFPSVVSEDFLILLRGDKDGALMILVFWCAVMRLSNDRWFLANWLVRTSNMAMNKMSGDWVKFLSWPMSILKPQRTVSVKADNQSRMN